MVEKEVKINYRSDEQKDDLLKHIISDNNDHNAFYIEIRSGNRDELETLINLNDKSPYDTRQNTDNLLAEAYEELMLKNLPLTKDMKFFVEEKLINPRFFIERNDQNVKKVDNVKKQTETFCDQINQLKNILIARFVDQNIYILKRQLKSTYDKLLWEEMEFCVVKLVLNEARLLNHPTNFEETLNKSDIEKDINSICPKQVYIDLSDRNSAIKEIIESNSSFQELYNDYEILKNVYSLKRIESYVKLASSIDLDHKPDLRILAIERTLQISGESLKNTLGSPNVSDEIHKVLLDSAPNRLRETINSLRDLLSHNHTLTKKVKLEDRQTLHFILAIQEDLRKVGVDIGDIFYKKKVDAIRIFLNKIINCNDFQEVKKLADSLTEAELGEKKLEYRNKKEFVKTKELIYKVSSIIKDEKEEEQGLFETLLQKGTKIDALEKNDWTPLNIAALNGHKNFVETLLQKRVKVDDLDKNGTTLLHRAALMGHKKVVEILLQKGAKLDALDKTDRTPLHFAAQNGYKDIVETLLQKGAKFDALDKNDWTPLHIAAQNGHKDIVETLLQIGAKVDDLDKNGWTPLHIAALNGHKDIVETLLQKGTNVDAVDKNNATPLHLAATMSQKEVVETLLDNGAKNDALDKNDWTPLHIAKLNGDKDIVETLL